jgi:hypothetical protein
MAQFRYADAAHVDVQINAVEENPTDSRLIALTMPRRTETFALEGPKKIARTGIHRCNQYQGTWDLHLCRTAGYGNGFVFERLPQDIQRWSMELRQFIQNETPL